MNALALALGLPMTLNTEGEFIEAGSFSSDTGEFSESVSSTDVSCTNLKVYNAGQVRVLSNILNITLQSNTSFRKRFCK